MSKKILFMSNAKLSVICTVLLLAVFCTIGMSFRPVYSEEEAELVVSGPRHSHWTTTDGNNCTGYYDTYHNKSDFGKVVAHADGTYGGSYVSAVGTNAQSLPSGNNSATATITWNCGSGSGTDGQTDKTGQIDTEVAHQNVIVFTAHPAEGYRFIGWYTAPNKGGVRKSEDLEYEETFNIPDKDYASSAVSTTYTKNNPWYEGQDNDRYAYFEEIPKVDVTFIAPSSNDVNKGTYTIKVGSGTPITISTENVDKQLMTAVTLTATPTDAYRFDHWYLQDAEGNKTFLSSANPLTDYAFDEATSVGALIEARPTNFDVIFKAVELDKDGNPTGSYTVDVTETVVEADYTYNTGDAYRYSPTLNATAESGYLFTGWYTMDGKKKIYLSTANPYTPTFEDETSIYAEFSFNNYSDDQKAKFKVGSYETYDLNDAVDHTSNTNKTIVCIKDGILSPGNYTIPKGITLFIPYNSSESVLQEPAVVTADANLSPYRTLYFMTGTNVVCNGTICVGGQIRSAGSGGSTGYPTGDCGVINMVNGGHIELNNGATMYVWGYVKGQDKEQGNNTINTGTISVNNGATVWEDISFGDFRGGTACAVLTGTSGHRCFPFQSYSIQNIEVPMTLHYGAQEKVYTNVYASSQPNKASTMLIGSSETLFLLKDNQSIVKKWYDPTTDLMCYELSGTAQLDRLKVSIGSIVDVDSKDYDLPITSGMHILMSNCNMKIQRPMYLQPGAIVEVTKSAVVNLNSDLYLYDKDQWRDYIIDLYFKSFGNLSSHKYRGDGTSKELLDDAKLIVDGTLKIAGNLYATSSGADVMGNGGGKIIFPATLQSGHTLYLIRSASQGNTSDYDEKIHYGGSLFGIGAGDVYCDHIIANAANLHNEDDSYTQSVANGVFFNVNGRWFVEGKQNEKEDHTYDFTFMDNGNTGDVVNTLAVYSKDKTGLEERMKWANVEQDLPDCPNNYNAADGIIYNYIMNNEWTQLIPNDLIPGKSYSGSDNNLYQKEDCEFSKLVSINDETCLYPFPEGNKALVNGTFIVLVPNAIDAAYRDADDKYYICFKGCNWHEATPYDGEQKTYNVVEGGSYIWYENDWLNVKRDEFSFYTTDDQNVKTYYEYLNGEWVIATPYVSVIDDLETRELFSLVDAFTIASGKKNATIKLLRDYTSKENTSSFTGSNTTCTLDLNGHTLTGNCTKLLDINASGSTFVITDRSEYKNGVIKNEFSRNGAIYTVVLTKGTLRLENGTVNVYNPAVYDSNTSCAASAIQVASGQTFNMIGGTVSAEGYRQDFAIESSGTTTLTKGTITANTVRADGQGKGYPYGVYVKAGTTTIGSEVTVTTHAGTTFSHPVKQDGGTLTINGGTFRAYSPKSSQTSYYSSAIWVEAGTANISNATLSAEITGTGTESRNAYGVYSKGTTTLTNCVVSGTTKTSAAYGVYVVGGTTTIVSGRYKGAATSSVAGVYKSAGTLSIRGGYYSHNTNLAGNLADNRGVFATTDAEKASYGSDMQYKVTEAYTITFMNDTEELQVTVQEKGSTPSYAGAEPTKASTETEEFAFDGWSSTNGGALLPSLPTITTTATYYAHFTTIGSKYKVTFDANGGTCDVKNSYIDEGAAVGTLPVATKTGYTFNGWFTETSGGTQISSSTVPTGHVTYYAQFTINQYTLTWNLEGGKVTTAGTAADLNASGTCSANIDYGTSITVPVVSKTGYTFAGWSSTPAASMPAANASYTASWTANTNTPYKVIHKLQNPLNLAEYTIDATENLSGTTGAYVAPKPKTTYVGYITPDAVAPTQIAADGSLEIVYQYDCITYTIAFDATTNGGQCAQVPVTVVYGYTIPFLPNEESVPSVSKEGNDFVGWFTKAIGGDEITTSTTILYNIGTLYAQFRAKPRLEVGVEDAVPEAAVVPINVSNNSTVETTIVRSNGKLTVTSGRKLTTTDLIIEASPDNSGEVFGTVEAENIYFDLTRGAGNVFKHHTWYAFSVPFQARVADIQFDGETMQYAQTSKKDDYDILYYAGSERAANGKAASCWKYIEFESSPAERIVYPGTLYMIANTRRDVHTIRFTKLADAPMLTTSVKVSAYASANTSDANWNGIGNPALFHANMAGLGAAGNAAWVYNPDGTDPSNYYQKIYLNAGDIILGQGIFVQTPTPQTFVVSSGPASVAQRRVKANDTDTTVQYQVMIARDGRKATDDVIISMDKQKEEDVYVLGQDLVRMGMSTINPQMWVDRYNEKLCVNVQAPLNNVADYPLGIFAPANAEYTIYIANPSNDETKLYLTMDGVAIWNLSESAYTLYLDGGTTNRYGLRIVAPQAPEVATGMDEAVVDAHGETQKVLIDNIVYIIRNGEVYTITGQKVQ